MAAHSGASHPYSFTIVLGTDHIFSITFINPQRAQAVSREAVCFYISRLKEVLMLATWCLLYPDTENVRARVLNHEMGGPTLVVHRRVSPDMVSCTRQISAWLHDGTVVLFQSAMLCCLVVFRCADDVALAF